MLDDPADDSPADDGADENEEVSEELDFNNDFPTDWGHFSRDVSPAMKHAILEHGPCRPTDEKYFVDNDGKKTFYCLITTTKWTMWSFRASGYAILPN